MKAAMHLLFEDGAEIKAATLLAQQGESWQAEDAHGKRIKIKDRQVLLQFSQPHRTELMQRATTLANEIDLAFLWECAPEEEFNFTDFANEYFGESADPIQKTAIIIALHNAPIYFRRKGKGRFQRAPEEQLKAALVAIERKKAQAQRQQEFEDMLKSQQLPESFVGKEISLLFNPDKNSIEFKALEAAARALNTTPVKLLIAAKGISSPLALHNARFMAEHFPSGQNFPAYTLPKPLDDLPLADVQAFSIDDVTTTEIDDAFSVQALPDHQWRIGIHIAAPALGITRNDALDAIAYQRLSTVYLPGEKITMLPEDVIDIFTLKAGHICPAVSLYLIVDGTTWEIQDSQTRIERITVAHNLRHNLLDDLITEENLDSGMGDYPCKEAFSVLWPLTNHLHGLRQEARLANGLRPESHTRADYSYYLDDTEAGVRIRIEPRKRGAPLDKIVAEMMILANSTWGKLLADMGIPGIYRAQRGWGMIRTRMQTTPAPHEGLGVAQYAWSTSPLRRYVDLVNQWQIIAAAQHGVMAKMVAPFAPKDIQLLAITNAFDTTYGAYIQHQNTMERYWCLRWLQQEQRLHLQATVIKDNIVRLTEIPLVFPLPDLTKQSMPRGTAVLLEINEIDEIELLVNARLLEVLDQALAHDTFLEGSDSLTHTIQPSPKEAAS